ncbi:MAG: SprB repeat-containing protein, partial [Flavobacteriales bacterium]|nr:SprB repeat-containing protein [Flavobacteriales bacterium]
MKTNRIFQVCAVFLCLNIAYQNQTKASHAVGSDLTYTCLGGNNYEVSLAFYRDCSGANAPNSPTVTISSQTCGFTGANDIDVKLNLEPGYPVDVTPVCGAIQTDCVPGANGYRGVEKRVYKGLVTLPQSCTDWVFSYRICCRNPAITNIQNPGGQGMYVEATLDNLNAPCNSSSTFSNDPVPYACINKQFCFNQGSQDPDGDLLTYTLIDPKTDNAGGTVTYSPGFSAVSPVSLPPGSAFNIDPNTGDICFISNAIEVTVLAVLVEEWRGGIKIGSTIRDIQLNTIACNNDNPEPGDIFGNSAASGAFSEVVCAGSPVVFTIQGFDPDINDQLTMTWNNGIPAGNWNVVNQGTNNPTATFTWNPTAADISAVPYTFTVSIEDDACPIKGTFTRAYSVTVQGINVDAGLDENPAACGLTYARNAVAVGGTPPYLFEWSDGTVGAAINNMECGKYYVTVTDANGCEGIDSVSIKCPDIQIIAANITPESCYGDCDGEVQLAVNGGAAPYNYAWSNNVANGDLAVGLCAGSHWVTVTDQGGCSDSLESKIIAGDIVPNLFLTSDDSLCEGAASIPLGTNYPGGAWSGNGVNNAVNPSEFDPVVAGPGIHNVTYTLVMPNGICQTQQNMPIEVLDIDITPVVIEPLCNGGNDGIVNLTDNNNNITDFHFFNGVFATVQGNGQFGGLTAGNYTITGADIGSKFCPTNIPVVVTEPQALANVMAAADISCFGLCDGNIIANPAGGTPPYAYSWNTAQNSANLINLCAGNYSVTITDDNGCNLVDNGNIVEPADFNIQEVIVNANCDKYDGSITLNVGGAAGGFVYQWDNAAVTANLNNVDSGTYVVTITDANNCAKVHNVIVPANPGPSVNVVSSMTTCYGDCDGTATAVGNGGTTPGQYTYAWSNGQLVSVANGLCAGNYTVTVFDGNNCSFETNIAVSEPSQVRVAIDHYPDTTICIGGTASFTATAEGGSGQGFTYTWDNGWVGPGQHDDLPAVPTCYTVTAFDDNNCPSLPLTSCVD